MNAPFEQSSLPRFAASETAFRLGTDIAANWTVEVLDGDRPVTLGEVVSRDGLILAKASGLPHAPTCRLADGRLLPARVVRTNAQNLATVNVEVTGLPAVEWAESGNPGVGTALVVATPAGLSAAGFVSHPPVAIPAERGILWLRLRDAEPGLEA